jgi:hypothetical protein
MVRFLLSTLVVLMGAASSQAALLASYNFSTNLSSSYVDPLLLSSSTISNSPNTTFIAQNAALGGTGRFSSTTSGTYNTAGSFTISADRQFRVDKVTFDLFKYVSTSNQGRVQVSAGGVNRQSNSTTGSGVDSLVAQTLDYTNVGGVLATFNTVSSKWELTLALQTRSSGGSVSRGIDNLQIDGIVPEPASMAVFGVLGLAGVAYRRRFKKSTINA